jgi:predicted nucleic acid-binding protein
LTVIAFDAKFLFFLFDSKPAGSADDVARVEHLFRSLNDRNAKIIVPTPALAELLVGAVDRAPDILARIDKTRTFKIEPFGTMAAVELAAIEAKLIEAGNKRDGSIEPYQKLKFDRQICAIAKVSGCSAIYSQDNSLRAFAKSIGLEAISVSDLPLPPSPAQDSLF